MRLIGIRKPLDGFHCHPRFYNIPYYCTVLTFLGLDEEIDKLPANFRQVCEHNFYISDRVYYREVPGFVKQSFGFASASDAVLIRMSL